MPVIYFDNFRGFNETFLPLKKVNFFVGENSTGKTSVLKLIKIISDHRFWFMQDFNNDQAELGYFSEIVSTTNSTKKFFEIGLIGDKNDNEKNISAIKMKFFEKEGLPELREMSLIDDSINIQVLVEDDEIKYRFSEVNLKNVDEKNKLKYFKLWVKKPGLDKELYHTVKLEGAFFKQALLWQIDSIIKREIKKKVEKDVISGLRIPSFLKEIAWLAPIRTEPKRTYDNYKPTFSPDGSHSPYVLKKLLSNTRSNKKTKNIEEILNRFGKDSGLYDGLKISNLGKDDTSPFEIQILVNQKYLKITNVGYGVSQILPLIVEIVSRPNNTWFAIQQPEIHLHPKGQAAFGDFILKSSIQEDKCFIIETHSDYTLDRYRLKMSQNKINNPESQIVFFNRKKNENSLDCIEIKSNGTLSEKQPREFRDFFIKEELSLLKM